MKPKKSQIKFSHFKNKKILIMGLGLHGGGTGATEFFVKAGAKTTATDLRTKKQLKESLEKLKGLPIKYVLGKHKEEDFKKADLIIRNPAVPDESPYLKIAKKHNIPIDTDMGIFFELCPTPIIGITGTRGKSTTSTLIYELLHHYTPFVIPAKAGIQKINNIILAGNIRKSVLLELPHITKNTLVVLELSSWQIEGLAKRKKSPHIAVITNIMPDHLNRYSEPPFTQASLNKGMEEYIKAKKGIFKFQTKNDFLFLNQNDKIVKEFAKEARSRVIFYGAEEAEKRQSNLLGTHNLSNIAAAVKVAKHLGVGDSVIRKVLKNFKGLEGRLQTVATINNVRYINDTTSTTPDAAIAAINSLVNSKQLIENNLILIAGGADKNLDFRELARLIAEKVSALILLNGAATNKLKESVEKALKIKNYKLKIYETNNMVKAVRIANNIAMPRDFILLSPACASFGMFRHEFERGNKFNEAVESIK